MQLSLLLNSVFFTSESLKKEQYKQAVRCGDTEKKHICYYNFHYLNVRDFARVLLSVILPLQNTLIKSRKLKRKRTEVSQMKIYVTNFLVLIEQCFKIICHSHRSQRQVMRWKLSKRKLDLQKLLHPEKLL